MIETLRRILEGTLDRLSQQITAIIPGLLAGLTILLAAYVLARIARWLLVRIFKGIALDRFLLQSGLSTMLDRSGGLRATSLVARGTYWIILLLGLLTALSAFDTNLSSEIIEALVFLFPKVITAALIVLGGVWLGQYLGRSILVWAVNEGLPRPRPLAGAVRAAIVFVSVVVAAVQLNFASNVFFAAFVLLFGGVILALSLALGLGSRESVRRYFQEKHWGTDDRMERSLRDQL
jgi:mechanosensitive ion channel-like protein